MHGTFVELVAPRPWGAAAFAIALAVCSLSEAQEPSVLRRFQSEAPRAWSELIAMASCVEGECSNTKTDLLTGNVISELEPVPFRINGHLAYHSYGKGQMVTCQGSDYEFIVEKQEAGLWGMRQLLWSDDQGRKDSNQPYCDPVDGTLGHLPWQMALAYPCRGIIISTTWLPHLAASPTFKVIDAAIVRNGDGTQELVHIRFNNKAQRGPAPVIESGELTLDPDRYWQIVVAHVMVHYGYEGKRQCDCVIDINNEFEEADQRMPYAARETQRIRCLPTVDTEDVYVTKVALRDQGDVKPFTLSAFGLPEPVKEPQTPAVMSTMFRVNALLVSALVCVCVYWKVFRRTAPT